jgi:hypothetical protein
MNTKKGIALVAIILIIIGVLVVGGGIYWWQKSKVPAQKACTQEAKICPDGSSVGRTGPNCEFAACPTSTSSITVVSPNGGEIWKTGEDQIIRFNLSAGFRGQVHIQLFKAGQYVQDLTSFNIGDEIDVLEIKSYQWHIPSNITIGNDYKIRIVKIEPSGTSTYIYDDSDAPFNIIK